MGRIFGKPVRGERENTTCLPARREVKKWTLNTITGTSSTPSMRSAKRAIRNESANAFRQVRVQQDRFVSLSDLSEESSEALATYDLYPWEYTSFPVDGDVILIKDDRLADALTTRPLSARLSPLLLDKESPANPGAA